MLKKLCYGIFLTSVTFLTVRIAPAVGQSTTASTFFGQNKVQYKNMKWYYVQSDHFDVYFYEDGEELAEYVAETGEECLNSIESKIGYRIKERVPILVYKSHNDFQQTNAVMEYMEEGIGGVTESFKNRVIFPYEGDYAQFRHVINHELVHAHMNDMLYGGGLAGSIYSQSRYNIPLWYAEGLAEYLSTHWDTRSDMMLRDWIIGDYPIEYINPYWGGNSMFNYIEDTYGAEKVGEVVRKVRQTKDVNRALKAAVGMDFEEFGKKWELYLKRQYWPDIENRKKTDEFAKQMTDHTKRENYFNLSPVLSPNGDKIAFLSDRDDYADIFIMSAIDGKLLDKVISGQKSPEFEEMHWLSPGLSWSPDGNYLALAAKGKDGLDVLYTVNVKTKDKKSYRFDLDGAFGSSWSPNGEEIAFVGHKAGQEDIYAFNVHSGDLRQITNDPFSDDQPAWSPDGKKIAFISDRQQYINPDDIPRDFRMSKHDVKQKDLYIMNADGSHIMRITDTPYEESWPSWAPDGEALALTAEKNGISNIFLIDLKTEELQPLTNALTGCFQVSWSKDGSKMVFSSYTNYGWDIYMIKNPLDIRSEDIHLENTVFFKKLEKQKMDKEKKSIPVIAAQIDEQETETEPAQGDFSRYIFDEELRETADKPKDKIKIRKDESDTVVDNNKYKTPEGEYLVKKYKLKFSPDIVMGSAGYNTYFGVQGTSTLLLSDVMGNHQIYVGTDLFFDLKNSTYFGQYMYMPRKTDYGLQVYHIVNFFYDYGFSVGLPLEYSFRLRNYGFDLMFSRPFNKFSRVEGSVGYAAVGQKPLDNYEVYPEYTYHVFRPSISYVKDTSMWSIIQRGRGPYGPSDGTRMKFTLTHSPSLGKGTNSLNFTTGLFDYRRYFKMKQEYSFMWRLNAGASFGKNPEHFFIGGVENWLNYEYYGTRRSGLEDIFFTQWMTPLRGAPYYRLEGDRGVLMNAEFRFPLIRYLVFGWPLPLALQNIRGAFFYDVGAAWFQNDGFELDYTNPFTGQKSYRDLMMGYGLGVSSPVLFFLLRFDVAWSYDGLGHSKPQYLFSMGLDL